jgi:hypothetical protein
MKIKASWERALENAVAMMEMDDEGGSMGLLSPLKQAASDEGIEYETDEMSQFVDWAMKQLTGE